MFLLKLLKVNKITRLLAKVVFFKSQLNTSLIMKMDWLTFCQIFAKTALMRSKTRLGYCGLLSNPITNSSELKRSFIFYNSCWIRLEEKQILFLNYVVMSPPRPKICGGSLGEGCFGIFCLLKVWFRIKNKKITLWKIVV